MKQLVTKQKLSPIVGALGLCALVILSLLTGGCAFTAKDVPVLMYHKIDDQALTEWWVSADNLRDQLFLLHDLGYETVDYDDLYAHYANVAKLPPKPVLITFDDIYQNIYTHALPLLNEHTNPKFFAVAQLTTDYVADDDQNRQLNVWDQPPEPNAMHPIWPELEELHNAGWAFEAHSRSHPHVNDISYNQGIYEAGTRDVIATKLGIPKPNFYIYPFGESNAQLIEILQAKGYTGGAIAWGGIENTRTMDLWHIKRVAVLKDDDLKTFASKINESLPTIFRLRVNIVGAGSVRLNPDRPFYYKGNLVTLTATAAPSSKFSSWTGDRGSNKNPVTIKMNTDKTVTATFTKK